MKVPSELICKLTPAFIKEHKAQLDKSLLDKHLGVGPCTKVSLKDLVKSVEETCKPELRKGTFAAKLSPKTSEEKVKLTDRPTVKPPIQTPSHKLEPEPSVKEEVPSKPDTGDLTSLEEQLKPKVNKPLKPPQVPPERLNKDAPMAAWAKAVEDVAASLPETCRSGEFDGMLAEFLKTFEYKGFDVEKIRRVFAERMSKIKPGSKLVIGTTELALDDPTKANSVICFLVALFNLRGTNLDSVLDGLEGSTKTSFKALTTCLALQSKVTVSGKSKSSDTLTLSRLAAAFPIHAVCMATDEAVTRKVINMREIGLNEDPMGKALMHPMAASVISDAMINAGTVFVTFWASYKLNQLIGGKNKAAPDRLWLFHRAALQSKAATTAQREALWSHLKVEVDPSLVETIKLAKTAVGNLVDNELFMEIEAFAR